ncbi:MAG: plasmid stabilization system [Cyanobacteria bacterium SBLK]|nr:plasmid stabilization system [Cyanobacteria bacterium SBLK]
MPLVHQERRKLPGVVRQRIKKLIGELAIEPRPHNSIQMRSPLETGWEVRRIRMDSWRILYVVDESFKEVGVIAIRKRPPYNYEDLMDLLKELE